MKRWFKNKLRQWLFADEELEYQMRLNAQKQLQESANIVTLARQQLSGFDPKAINFEVFNTYEELSVLDELEDEEERNNFINEAHALYTNTALKRILDFLTRHQVLYGQKTAETLLALNFSRATINGLVLLWGEIQNLEGQFQAKHTAPEPYDPYEVT